MRIRVSHVAVVTGCIALSTAIPASAQVPPSGYGRADQHGTKPTDSLTQAGARDGHRDARRRSIAGQFALGVTGGVPAGPLVVAGFVEPISLAGGAFLVVGVEALGESRSARPSRRVRDELQRLPEPYTVAYQDAFRREWTRRRGRARHAGLLSGAVVGVGVVAWLFVRNLDTIGG